MMSQRTRRTQLVQHLQAELIDSPEAEAITDRLIARLVDAVVSRLPWWVPFKGQIADRARAALDDYIPDGLVSDVKSLFNGEAPDGS